MAMHRRVEDNVDDGEAQECLINNKDGVSTAEAQNMSKLRGKMGNTSI